MKSDGKTPSERERLIRVVIGSIRASMHDLRRNVGMISRAHEELDDPEIERRTSSVVVGVKQESKGGGVVEGKCGDTLLSTESVEVSFETLSEKNLRNDEARSDAVEKKAGME